MKPTFRLFLAILVLFVAAQLTFAQGVATGDLHITVKDPKGNLVTNAVVNARDVAKGVERTASADGRGGYGVPLLPPGEYVVTVEAPGFAKAQVTGVDVTVGGLVELPVNVTIATGKELVEVSAQAELVETSRSSTTDTVGERRIENLPINGRNYIQFTLTDSQVVRDSAPSLGAAPTSGLNMSGQRGRSNLVNVDGADATDNSVNGVRSTVSQEAVQEFQIISNSYAAEYGRASGGVVNIISKSGSNEFHGDVFGYLRNRNFQAVNPFSTVSNPAYTRVQAGAAFGGPIKKDKTYYYFSYEVTRRHETGFSSVGQNNFGFVPFDASPFFGAPPGTFNIQVTPQQAGFLSTPGLPLQVYQQYSILAGGSAGAALNGTYPAAFALLVGAPGGLPIPTNGSNPLKQFITTCNSGAPLCIGLPASYQPLAPQGGNYPVFEGTSLYSLRLDHNVTNNNRLTFRVNASPSTVTGIEVAGQDQPVGQNAYSRTSQQTFRDVAGLAQDTWTIGGNKVNEFRFQYARRGLSFFYNTAIPAGSDSAINIPGFGYFGREPYSYVERTEQRYQVTDNFSWAIGRHSMKFGGDFNFLPLKANFTVNYGGVYDFGSFSVAPLGLPGPDLSPVQAYGAGLPSDFIQGIGNPRDSFNNIPIGFFWQDSWRAAPRLTVNYGVRYDVEVAPKFKAPAGIAQPAYNILGLQKGIQTDKNNIQPRLGVAWDPKGDGKTVVRTSFGMFYDHPLLALYFLGDASDGSTSGQLGMGGTGLCGGPGDPANLNAIPIFQGLIPGPNGLGGSPFCSPTTNPAVLSLMNSSPDQQRFSCPVSDRNCGVSGVSQSIFLGQNYLNLAQSFLPNPFQPFGYPQGKNFVYAYSQQANLTLEQDLGHGMALSLAYNFNGGRHINRPINANAVRGDLMMNNLVVAQQAAQSFGIFPGNPNYPTNPFLVGTSNAFPPCGIQNGKVYVPAALTGFFRPGGLNPSIAAATYLGGGGGCVTLAQSFLASLPGFNATCNPAPPAFDYTGCVPFSEMYANYSNGTSNYHGFTANLRKRFSSHYEFLASYTWAHAIDDSTDLQATVTPQDNYFPNAERSNSLFDQRHRFVFSGVYQTGKLSGSGFASKFLSNWSFAPLVEFNSGRPFNIITGNDDNLQLESKVPRPNTFVNPACGGGIPSKYSPTGVLQEPCLANFNGTLQSLDGNLGRNAGITPWTAFGDLRVSRRIFFGERYNMELIADMFNIANRYNVSSVSPFFQNAGEATSAYDPRQFQFALKFNW